MYCSPDYSSSDHDGRHPASPTRLDLSGTWKFTPIRCLPSETECSRQLAELPASERTFQIDLPDNLRRRFPWFTGEGRFTRDFNLPVNTTSEGQMQLLIGGIGSLDRVFINGEEVGDSGYSLATNTDARFHSTWSKVRYYSVHHSILQERNRIEIHFVALDVKAGVHRGPIVLGTADELYSRYWWSAFLFEYIYQAETILAFFIFFFFLIYTLAPPVERGFRYMTAAFAAYAIHSLYFIPLPIALDYLLFLKLQWVARILSQQWIIISMLLLVRLSNRRIEHFVHVIAGVLILVTFTAPSYSRYFSIATWIQLAFQLEILYFLGVYLLQHRERGDRSMIKVVLTVNLIVTLAYISDLLLRLYVFNTPWVYHYMALLNMLQFLGLYSYKMYA
ncbi:MAG: hypothetical protein KDK34_13890, partial [Leptospiraceae bacterium]|nr:hypothetical protein [Leptospiraceae bacterium]